jgi:GDP-L-fucose synthase
MASASPDPGFWSGKTVAVTGGGGFLGRPTVAGLEELGAEVRVIRSAEYDLRERQACFEALEGAQVVLHLAANVGGIGYNRRNPGPLAHDNLAMGLNVFEACRELGTEKLVAAGSVCAYPKFTPVPFDEDDIWDGYPEESNAPYGVAKKTLFVLSDA